MGKIGFAQAKCDDTGGRELFNEGFENGGAGEEKRVFKEGVLFELSTDKFGVVGCVGVDESVDPVCTPKHNDPLRLSR